MDAFSILREDMATRGVEVSDNDWSDLSDQFSPLVRDKGQVIFPSGNVGDRWLFLGSGIAAAEQTSVDGEVHIARFFSKGEICGNLKSTWQGDLGADTLIAITPVTGLTVSHDVFRHEYLDGGVLGRYLRLKLVDTLLAARDVIVTKTINDTEAKYQFLEHRYGADLARIPKKHVARFLGITPQGLSRFLRSSGRVET
ncbi:MAG: cyclic nucleotide-binding domain-containing protein [Pseudomonadota bacterium]